MEIVREVDGVSTLYILTEDELYTAFYEQQAVFKTDFLQTFLAEKLGRALEDTAEDRALFHDVYHYFEKCQNYDDETEINDAEMAYENYLAKLREEGRRKTHVV